MSERSNNAIHEFLTSAETGAARKEVIQFALQSVSVLRSDIKDLSLTETFAAYRYELQTFKRTAILKRLRQHARGRAGQVVDEFLQSLDNTGDK